MTGMSNLEQRLKALHHERDRKAYVIASYERKIDDARLYRTVHSEIPTLLARLKIFYKDLEVIDNKIAELTPEQPKLGFWQWFKGLFKGN